MDIISYSKANKAQKNLNAIEFYAKEKITFESGTYAPTGQYEGESVASNRARSDVVNTYGYNVIVLPNDYMFYFYNYNENKEYIGSSSEWTNNVVVINYPYVRIIARKIDSTDFTDIEIESINVYLQNTNGDNNLILLDRQISSNTKNNFIPIQFPSSGEYTLEIDRTVLDKCLITLETSTTVNRALVISENGLYNAYNFTITPELLSVIKYLAITFWNSTNDVMGIRVGCGVNYENEKRLRKKVGVSKYTQRLIGAIFYDGWNTNWNNTTYSTKSQTLYAASSIYNASYPDWRDYTQNALGFYPTEQTSFSNVYPDIVATMQDGNGNNYPLLPSRQPLDSYEGVNLGWRNTGLQTQIDAQINMAAAYGVDYFAFVGGFRLSFDAGVFSATKFWESNPALKKYMDSPNKSKIKFCFINSSVPTNATMAQLQAIRSFVANTLTADDQYLYLNDRPVLLEYVYELNPSTSGIFSPQAHIKKTAILSSGYNGFGIDGKFSYGGSPPTLPTPTTYTQDPFVNVINNLEKILPVEFGLENGIMLFPACAGRGESARSDFTKKADFAPATKAEILTMLKTVINYLESINTQDRAILIYAWNEFCEGGWLMPTKYEIDSGFGFGKLEALQDSKSYWQSCV